MSKILMKINLKNFIWLIFTFAFLSLLVMGCLFFSYSYYLRTQHRFLKIEYELIKIGDFEGRLRLLMGDPVSIRRPGDILATEKKERARYGSLSTSKEKKIYCYRIKYSFSVDGFCVFTIENHVIVDKHFYE